MIRYGQAHGRRYDAQQRVPTPEEAERARAQQWLRDNPKERECWIVDGRPRSAAWTAAEFGFESALKLRKYYATGPLWHRGRMVRRYERR